MRTCFLPCCLAASIASTGLQAQAQGRAADPHCPPVDAPVQVETPVEGRNETVVGADRGTALHTEDFVLEGNVVIRRGARRLEADSAFYKRSSDILEASGNIEFLQNGVRISGDTASVDFAADKARITDARYALADSNAHGEAAAVLLEPTQVQLDGATYSTCPPGREAWLLRAREIRLDAAEYSGEARAVTLRLAGVPVFYLPYATFPLGRRKSGLLAPVFTSSDSTGIDISAPYYLNLAPNRDATLSPRLMTERGILLKGEYRYLNPADRGQADVEYVPFDARAHRERALFAWRHDARVSPALTWDADLRHVTDEHYFRELGSDLGTSSQIYLERRVNAAYNGSGWQLRGQVQDFQLLDPTIASPYQRVPQLVFVTAGTTGPYTYRFTGDFSHFTGGIDPVGTRIDLDPTIALPLLAPYGFITPRLGIHHTSYFFDTAADQFRTLPTYSIDSGLYFERTGTRVRQTLEPRLFYVYTPHEAQDAIPNFDTGLLEFNFAGLFQDRRYAGPDRIGDQNALSAAVTTRFIAHATGRETVRLGLGQTYYLRDQLVTLPGEQPFRAGDFRSLAELSAQIGAHWYSGADVQWNSGANSPEKGAFRLNYAGARTVADVAYRLRRGVSDQTDVAALWRITRDWRVGGRWLYSLREGRTLDASFGFGYEGCCWALRAMARRYVNDPSGATNTNVGIQLELKGLTSVGRQLEESLSESIAGFRPEL